MAEAGDQIGFSIEDPDIIKQEEALQSLDSEGYRIEKKEENELSDNKEVQDSLENDEKPQESPLEAEVRSQGWVNKDEWVEQGKDPELWVNPAQFKQRGELMSRIQEQSTQLTKQGKQVDKLSAALKAQHEMGKKQLEQQKKQLLKELGMEKAEAIKDGDVEQIAKLEEVIEEVKETDIDSGFELDDEKPNQTPEASPEDMAAFEQFMERNTWYSKDVYLRAAWNAVANEIGASKEGQSKGTAWIIEEATKEVIKNNQQNPNFKKPSPPRDNNGNGDGNRSSEASNSWSQLTPEEKAIGATFISEGLFKNKAEYAAEVIALRGE